MITKAYIHQGKGQVAENAMIQKVLEARGVDCQVFTTEDFHQGLLTFDQQTVVACDLSVLRAVFQQIGFQSNETCYPKSLHPYLKRNLWETTMGELLEKSQTEEVSNIFIKPKYAIKLFTGFVVHDHDDLELIDDIPADTILYCSEVVHWYSEYRVYVQDAQIVGVKNYRGDRDAQLNMEEVEEAVARFEQSGESTAGYGVDFGVLLNEETALIEWNDCTALGNYDLDPVIYTDLFLARWEEILQEAKLL